MGFQDYKWNMDFPLPDKGFVLCQVIKWTGGDATEKDYYEKSESGHSWGGGRQRRTNNDTCIILYFIFILSSMPFCFMNVAWQNSHLSQLNNGGELNITSSLFFIIKVCPMMLIHMYLYPFIFHIGATTSIQRDLFFFFKKLELISLVTLSKDFCIRNKFTWISFHIKAWRSFNIGSRETLNGDTSSSSLAAKGFRSVRPNLQEKKSPTQVNRELYTVTLPLSMLCFQKKGLFIP